MSIIDKARAVVTGDNAVATAVHEQTETRQRIAQLSERGEALAHQLAQAKALRGELALDETATGRRKYDEQLATVQRLEADLTHNSDAQAAMSAKLQEIARRIGELTHADTVKTFTRLGAERLKKAERLQEACATYAEAYRAFLDSNEKIRIAWPGIAPLGVGLGATNVENATAVELFRQWPVNPLDKRSATAVPGAHHGLGLGAPDAIQSLVDAVNQQNAAMLDKIKASTAKPPQASLAETFERTQPTDVVETPLAPAATQSAAAIMATMPKRPRATLDHRTRK